MSEIADAINDRLKKIPLSRDEKDFIIQTVASRKFRQCSIWLEAGGYFGVALGYDEPVKGEWFFYWVYPRDHAAPDQTGIGQSDHYNVHYTLRMDGDLVLTRDE